ncbi:MAG: hypothetical protein ACLP4V_01870 [Methylocella sp.]
MSALFSSEFGAVHSCYAARIEATRRSPSSRDIATAVRLVLHEQSAALRALANRLQEPRKHCGRGRLRRRGHAHRQGAGAGLPEPQAEKRGLNKKAYALKTGQLLENQ